LVDRVAVEGFAAARPSAEGPFGDSMNGLPKHVGSSTLTEVAWNAQVLTRNVPDAVRSLRTGDGALILVTGNATLVHTLLAHDLFDTLRLMVFPVSIGPGLRVFPGERRKQQWRLCVQRTFPNRVVVSDFIRD
jgi:dihydrofolate reductase